MGRRGRKSGRQVNGILLLDKPKGVSSNKALQQVKKLYNAQKAGHTGSLDPLATGLLPICFGEATKVSAFLLDADKRYRVTIKLGEKTATADAEGAVLQSRPVQGIDESDVKKLLAVFTGKIQQLPPMYSALKHEGQRLYKLARQGLEVERQPREITIYALELVEYNLPEIVLDVHCSKGTYVRTLAEDIGEHLGCGAHVLELRRTSVASFDSLPVSMNEIMQTAEKGFDSLDALLLPMDTALAHWQEIHLTEEMTFYIRQGQAVMVPKAPTDGLVRLYDPENVFVGVGLVQPDGMVAPKRLIKT